jgi:hypothetical protein
MDGWMEDGRLMEGGMLTHVIEIAPFLSPSAYGSPLTLCSFIPFLSSWL